ncbi:MAG: hypothetical protein K6E84_00275 [Lachnospiraceae bacterium]|nr:hypothetical protein [Lachnospiraceae bacterium]
MLLVIAMIILLIVIIALIIKYVYVQAHILSSKEFRKTAEKKSVKMRVKNTEITCDYCGGVIDTAKDKRCPNCAAVYGEDAEFKNRFKVDEKAVEKMANTAANDAVAKAHQKGLETLKQLRVAIIVLVCIFALMVVCAVFTDRSTPSYTHKYRGNEELKHNSYSEYTLIDSPEVTILDRDGVTLRLMKVYADTDNGTYGRPSYSYRVAFSLVNTRKEPVTLTLKCVGVNGRCKSRDYIYIYSHFDKNSDVVFYENVYGEWFESIDEIVIGECCLRDDNEELYKKSTMETFKLTDKGYAVITDDQDLGSVIFENDAIRIRSQKQEDGDGRYDVWIENLSENNYYIDASDMKVDGEVNDSYILYDAGLPAGYTLHHDSVYGLGEEYKERAGDAAVEVSFSFSDTEDPRNDFSTGYITLK